MNETNSKFRSLTFKELRKLPKAEREAYKADIAVRNKELIERLKKEQMKKDKLTNQKTKNFSF